MPLAIDEVTAEVAPPQTRGQAGQAAGEKPSSSPAEQRRQREQFDEMQQRAKRVCAN